LFCCAPFLVLVMLVALLLQFSPSSGDCYDFSVKKD
jgi:hypothetical protein